MFRPTRPHLVTNGGETSLTFLVLQGVGEYVFLPLLPNQVATPHPERIKMSPFALRASAPNRLGGAPDCSSNHPRSPVSSTADACPKVDPPAP